MIDHSLVTGFTMFIRRSLFDMACFGISTYHRHEPPLTKMTMLLSISSRDPPGLF